MKRRAVCQWMKSHVVVCASARAVRSRDGAARAAAGFDSRGGRCKFTAVNQHQFEERALHLWMTTRVPLTRANLLFYTRAPRKKLDAWLDELVGDGILDVDSDAEGEMTWAVRGAERPRTGPTRIEEIGALVPSGGALEDKLARLRREAVGHGAGLALASRAGGLVRGRDGQKSLLAAGLLGFFFGPVGWLYAAPWIVAAPAAALTLVIMSLHLWWLLAPLSLLWAGVGVGYAWRYNQKGERVPLLGDGDSTHRALPRRR